MKWRFPLSGRNFRTGIKDAGTEFFTGNRIHSLAKEVCQNSLDAKINNNRPVIIEFKQYELKKEDFPDVQGLHYSLEQCYITSKKTQENEAIKYFQDALDIIQKDYIPFLRISDFNTTGLTGINKTSNSNWADLVRSAGVSNKSGDSGGSFGIGKNATYATSDLRTVFYSTYTIHNEKATQGVANLISYDVQEKDDFTQGRGHFAFNDNQDPIRELLRLDPSFSRNETGTDIYIAGYSFYNNSTDSIISSILDTYLYAIYEGTLIVKVDNQIINKETLGNIVKDYKETIADTTIELYELLTLPTSNTFYETIEEKDDLEIKVIIDPTGSRKVSMIRNPWMKIKELDRFPGNLYFKATGIIKGKNLNKILRKVENPQHNDWEPDRILNDIEEKRKAESILRKIRSKILEKIQNLYEPDLSEIIDIFGASDKIPLKLNENESKAKFPKISDAVKSIEIIEKITPRKLSAIDFMDENETDIYDEDGIEEDYDFMITPTNDSSRDKKPIPELDKFKKGKRVILSNRQLKVISVDRKQGIYKIVLDLDKNIDNTIISLNILDESGNRIKSDFKVLKAILNGLPREVTQSNMITNCYLKKGRNILEIVTNLKIYVGIGVEVSDVR